MLNIKKLINKLLSVPMIVEQGTSGIWAYRKWSNGTAECWGRYSKNVSANTVDNNNIIAYPFVFTTAPTSTLGMASGGADLYDAHFENGSTTASQIRLTLINRHTGAATIVANIYAIGRWK